MKRSICFLITSLLLLSCGKIENIESNESYESNISSIDSSLSIQPSYETNTLWIDNKIYGTFYFSSQESPLVILSHSAFLNGNSLKAYAKYFASNNINAFTFDFCGGSKNSKSKGDIKEMTIFSEVEDLKMVVDFFQKEKGYKNISLFGTSQGGLVSALYADKYMENIYNLILLYPAFNIADEIRKYTNNQTNMDIIYSFVGKKYIDTLLDYDIYANIGNYSNKVLIIHGTSDTTVPLEYSKKACQKYSNCILKEIAGAKHGFNADNYCFFNNYDNIVFNSIEQNIVF